jgi:hypothetical protein
MNNMKRTLLKSLCVIVCLLTPMLYPIQAQTVSVADFGLKPDTRENAVPFVQKALEACKGKERPTLVFPKGRYDFWPQHCIEREYFESNTQDVNPKRLAILIEELEGLTFDGSGSDFIFHDRMQPFTIDNSRNVTIRNVNVDWDIPLTAQATVDAATDEYVDLSINAYESPYIIENGKLVFVGEGWKSKWWATMEFDKTTRMVTSDSPLGNNWGAYRAEELEKGKVRLHYNFTSKPIGGNLLVLRHSERDHAGIFIVDSKNIQLENLNLYHYPGLGVLSQYSENLTYKHVNCIPNEQKGRILSGHDDGFQVSNCKGNVVIDNCMFHALMDDPINVHGTSVRVIEGVDAFTLRCKFMHYQSVGMTWACPGDTVGFIESKSMETRSIGIVKSFKKIDNEFFEVSFEQAIPKEISPEYALENQTWTCNVSITNSYFKSCRARGILLSTSGKVVIERNIFESSGTAILLCGDANYWYESGPVKNVLITKNIFRAPCMTSMYQFCEGVITICPVIPEKTAQTPAFHRNIIVTDNEFHLYDYPILYALSVENLEFSNNKLIRSYDYEPFHYRKDGLTFDLCKKVRVHGNTAEGDVLGKTIRLINTPVKECKPGKDSFFKYAK